MNDFEKMVEWLFKIKQIQQKTEEIQSQERFASQSQGANQQILQAIITSEKQTLEVIKLTRIIVILTLGLFLLGLTQIGIMLAKP